MQNCNNIYTHEVTTFEGEELFDKQTIDCGDAFQSLPRKGTIQTGFYHFKSFHILGTLILKLPHMREFSLLTSEFKLSKRVKIQKNTFHI